MRPSRFALTVLMFGLTGVGSAFAQAAPSPASSATVDKAALSKACSAQADGKGLHGKARKRFRSDCRRGKM